MIRCTTLVMLLGLGCADSPDIGENPECNTNENCVSGQTCCEKKCIPARASCGDPRDTEGEVSHWCGDVSCPPLAGYGVSCFGERTCQYGRLESTEPWHAGDRWSHVPPGTFLMGSPESELGRDTDELQHQVTHDRGFWIQTTEVTQGRWKALSGGANPACFQSLGSIFCSSDNTNDTSPVEMVDWYSSLAYANALSVSQGLQACYTLTGCAEAELGWVDGEHSGCNGASFVGLDCTGYRLPTEAEWEYAARAGTTTATYAGELSGSLDECTTAQVSLDGIAWWCGNSQGQSKPVATKPANSWGLHDMLGNVSEWTWNWYGSYPGTVTDPLGPDAGDNKVRRGGAWISRAPYLRAAYRSIDYPIDRFDDLGFRLVRTVPP